MVEKGKFLEIMMANLQSYLGPQGIKVELRKRFYSKKTGKQIGEIDIAVCGDFGTSKFFWGIECRDRPADGPQGIPFIELVAGKRKLLKPDKMIAVSSTGFTQDAEEFALSENIDLITLVEPTKDDLKDFLEVVTSVYTDWRIGFTDDVTINLIDPNNSPPKEFLIFKSEDAVFTSPPFEMQPQSLNTLVIQQIQKLLTTFNPDKPIENMPVEISAPLSIKLGGETYPLRNVIAVVDITPHKNSVRALCKVCRRLSDKENIALTSTTRFKIRDQELVALILVRKNLSLGGRIQVRIDFHGESGNKVDLPESIMSFARFWGPNGEVAVVDPDPAQ
jgi:hypothetical protein